MQDRPGRNPDLLTIEEAAAYLGRSTRWLYGAARQGRIPAARIAGEWTLSRKRLDAWLDEQFEARG